MYFLQSKLGWEGWALLGAMRIRSRWVVLRVCLAEKEAVAIYLLSLVGSGWLNCIDFSAQDELKCEEI